MSTVVRIGAWFAIITLPSIGCKETITNPPTSDSSLTEPAVQPRVIFTYPPQNTTGPYENFAYALELRFNKERNDA